MYPEREKLEIVISLMKGAEIVAGVVGTNMHNILFVKDNIKTFNLHRDSYISKFQMTIDKMKNSNSFYIDSYYEPIPSNIHFAMPFLIYPTIHTEKFFKDVGIKYNMQKIYKYFSYDFINYLYMYAINSFNNIDSNSITITKQDIINNLKTIFNNYPIEKINKLAKRNIIIDKIAWWIPIRKLRDNFRNKFKY